MGSNKHSIHLLKVSQKTILHKSGHSKIFEVPEVYLTVYIGDSSYVHCATQQITMSGLNELN